MESLTWKILKENRSDALYLTHVSMFKHKGKFCIDRNKRDKFWDAYSGAIEADPQVKFGIAEKPQAYLPVLVDVDIRRKMDDDEDTPISIYTKEHVKKLIEVYQNVLKQILEEHTDEELVCVFLSKKPYLTRMKDGIYTKHGFHLHFPNIFLGRVDHEVHLIPRIKDQVAKNKIFADVGFVDSASLIDTSYCKVPWLLYGGSKAENKDSYLVDTVYDHNIRDISLEDAFEKYKCYDKDESEIVIKGSVKKNLPRILSVILYGRDTKQLKSGLPAPMDINRRIKPKRTREERQDLDFHNNIEMVKRLTSMLSRKRAEDRNEWIRVGWVLYNIGNGCDDARDIWIDFSRKCDDKFEESECIPLCNTL